MAFTGILGTFNSRLGNIVLGVAAGDEGNSLEQHVQQTLDFVQEARANEIFAETSQVIVFSDLAESVVDYAVQVSQSIEFVQDAYLPRIFETVEQSLDLVQSVGGVEYELEVEQSLGLVQAVDVRGPILRSINHNLSLVQQVAFQQPIKNVTATQSLGLVQSVSRPIEVSVSQSIVFAQDTYRRFLVTQSLALVQSATQGRGRSIQQSMLLTHQAVSQAILNRTLPQSLGLVQSVTYLLDNVCLSKNYSPFVGTGSSEYTPPATSEPTLGVATLTLTHPYTSPTTTVVLRNPRFGNRDSLAFNRISRETRGGTLLVFADTTWPKTQVLTVEVGSLKPQQVEDLLDFFALSLGQEIGLLDHENRQWRGIILTPDADVSHVGRANRNVIFDFEGTLA